MLFQGLPQSSQVIISVALMLFLGFAMTRLTKKLHLPNVTAYIVCGILIGPYCLNLVPQRVIEGMDFLSDIALAFIAFSMGEFFRFSTLKKPAARPPSSRFWRPALLRPSCLFLPIIFWAWSLPSPQCWQRWHPRPRLPRP